MFCLTCGSFLAGTAFFILCGPIFVYTYGGLNVFGLYVDGLVRTRFIRSYVYNLALLQWFQYLDFTKKVKSTRVTSNVCHQIT